MTNCGCRVYDANTWGIKIEYCPMHKAAPELLEVARRTKDFMDHPDQRSRVAWGLIGRLEEIIAKAEGK